METVRTHRVGSITTGFAFIAFGVLFLLHLFLSVISYDVIFKLWPLILIGHQILSLPALSMTRRL